MRNGNRARAAAWMCAAAMAASLLGAHEVATVEQLVAALKAVNGGDADTVVRIAPGYYDVSGCAMDEKGCLSIQRANVVVEGTDPTSWRETADRNAKVVLDAKYARSVFNLLPALTGVRFHHLTIQNGTNTNVKLVDGAGAGIQHGWYKGTYAAVSNCVFRNNRAVGQGGGGHELNLYDCYFTNNVATEGGAVLATQVTRDSLFEYNSAVDNGGALRNGSEIQRCVFVGNTAGTGGCNYGADYWAVDCLCVSNTASRQQHGFAGRRLRGGVGEAGAARQEQPLRRKPFDRHGRHRRHGRRAPLPALRHELRLRGEPVVYARRRGRRVHQPRADRGLRVHEQRGRGRRGGFGQ